MRRFRAPGPRLGRWTWHQEGQLDAGLLLAVDFTVARHLTSGELVFTKNRGSSMLERAHRRVQEILANHRSPVPEPVVERLPQYVERRSKERATAGRCPEATYRWAENTS